jgi:hypothetical protein
MMSGEVSYQAQRGENIVWDDEQNRDRSEIGANRNYWFQYP